MSTCILLVPVRLVFYKWRNYSTLTCYLLFVIFHWFVVNTFLVSLVDKLILSLLDCTAGADSQTLRYWKLHTVSTKLYIDWAIAFLLLSYCLNCYVFTFQSCSSYNNHVNSLEIFPRWEDLRWSYLT